jgi:pimeloyl-ACP methyl ester carboxylesterase
MLRSLGVFAVALALTSCATAAEVSDGAQIVTAAGYAFNIVVSKGNPALPTIILDAASGVDSRQWDQFQPRISAETHAPVISYDRPGFGKSPLPDTPYDIIAESDAFREAVTSLGLGRRVILVGSSYGGFLAQLWASRAPSTVVGLLFLDPNSPAAVAAMGVDLDLSVPPNPQTPREVALARVNRAGYAQFVAVYANPLPQSVPVIVVSAEKPPSFFQDPRLSRVWTLSQELLAASSHDGKRIVAEGATHNVVADRPDVVAACIKELMSKDK